MGSMFVAMTSMRGMRGYVVLLGLVLLFCGMAWASAEDAPTAAAEQAEIHDAPRAEAAATQGTAEETKPSDDTCRTCVALVDYFFHDVLPQTARRYQAYLQPRDSSNNNNKDDATRGKEEGQKKVPVAHTPQSSYKQRMIAEVHEAIDGLCSQMQAHSPLLASLTSSLSPSTTPNAERITTARHRAVVQACERTLEELNEALAEAAFRQLRQPDTGRTTSDTHSDDTKSTARHASAATNTRHNAGKGITPGAFCEAQKMCLPYIQYHVSSEAEVARRLQRGRAAAAQSHATPQRRGHTTRTTPRVLWGWGGRMEDTVQWLLAVVGAVTVVWLSVWVMRGNTDTTGPHDASQSTTAAASQDGSEAEHSESTSDAVDTHTVANGTQ